MNKLQETVLKGFAAGHLDSLLEEMTTLAPAAETDLDPKNTPEGRTAIAIAACMLDPSAFDHQTFTLQQQKIIAQFQQLIFPSPPQDPSTAGPAELSPRSSVRELLNQLGPISNDEIIKYLEPLIIEAMRLITMKRRHKLGSDYVDFKQCLSDIREALLLILTGPQYEKARLISDALYFFIFQRNNNGIIIMVALLEDKMINDVLPQTLDILRPCLELSRRTFNSAEELYAALVVRLAPATAHASAAAAGSTSTRVVIDRLVISAAASAAPSSPRELVGGRASGNTSEEKHENHSQFKMTLSIEERTALAFQQAHFYNNFDYIVDWAKKTPDAFSIDMPWGGKLVDSLLKLCNKGSMEALLNEDGFPLLAVLFSMGLSPLDPRSDDRVEQILNDELTYTDSPAYLAWIMLLTSQHTFPQKYRQYRTAEQIQQAESIVAKTLVLAAVDAEAAPTPMSGAPGGGEPSAAASSAGSTRPPEPNVLESATPQGIRRVSR